MYAILNIVKRDGEQIYKLESKYLRYIDHIDIMDCASLKKQTISDNAQIKAMRKDFIGLYCMSEQEVILNSCLKFVGFEPFHYQPLCDEKMWEYADEYDDILDWVRNGAYDDDFVKTHGIKVYYGDYEMDCATDFTLHRGIRDYSAFHPPPRSQNPLSEEHVRTYRGSRLQSPKYKCLTPHCCGLRTANTISR